MRVNVRTAISVKYKVISFFSIRADLIQKVCPFYFDICKFQESPSIGALG